MIYNIVYCRYALSCLPPWVMLSGSENCCSWVFLFQLWFITPCLLPALCSILHTCMPILRHIFCTVVHFAFTNWKLLYLYPGRKVSSYMSNIYIYELCPWKHLVCFFLFLESCLSPRKVCALSSAWTLSMHNPVGQFCDTWTRLYCHLTYSLTQCVQVNR